jgi:sugar phosphate permease
MGSFNPPLPTGITGEAPQAVRPTRVRYLVLAAGCTMALLAYVHRLAFAVYAPEIAGEFALNDQDIGNLMSAFLVGYALFQVPAGLAGDRLGARLLLPLFILGSSVVTAAIALVPQAASPDGRPLAFLLKPLVLLLILRALFGAIQSGVFPVFTRVIADWMPLTERGSAQGAMWTASRLGGALVPVFLTWLLIKLGGWRAPLEIVAGLGLLWSAAFWYWFRNRPAEVARVNGTERALIRGGLAAADGGPRLPTPWGRVIGSRSVWCLCLMYGCCGPAGNFMLTLLPTYLRKQRSLTPETTAWLVGAPLAAGFVACMLGGLVSDRLIRLWGSRRWGRRANGLVGLTLAGLAFAATAFVDDVRVLGLLLCAAQFGNDFNMGPGWAACADVGERYAGTISGAMNMTSCFTGAAGATLAGYLFARGEATWVFVVFGGLWLTGALCWLGIDVTKPVTPAD